ncbi:uncharacterized protein LOC112084156 [Eutrema salsugineum]|uniref:uncharacterized protein LOC112084156 n=1 Tax=Eutrema salsugineum TaxID=72664 RepID=UPI000CECEA68|nr:uncharacterized protein LOC112084156 [Eutrema salsugineum]
MASQDSTNSPDLIVGSYVSFTSTTGDEFYEGTVYFFDPEDASFGIDDVSRTKVIAGYKRVEGCYQFFLKDIKDLRVIRVPKPKPTTNTTTKDDEKTTPGEASSSTSTSTSK